MEHIILIHGALGSKKELSQLSEELQKDFLVHNLDLPGHGGTTMPDYGFSIEAFGKFVLQYMGQHNITSSHIFGYSMGGYVGIYLAATAGEKIKNVVTLGTKFLWDEEIAGAEVKFLQPDMIIKKVPAFAEELSKRHLPEDWKTVVSKTSEMLSRMGIHNPLQVSHLQSIENRCLLLSGDRDKMVPLGETIAVYKQLRSGQLGIIPDTPHAIEKVNFSVLSGMITRFKS